MFNEIINKMSIMLLNVFFELIGYIWRKDTNELF